ncbi:MAG: N-acetylmuramoyl-L-alanine amidase [Planctomycetes bacterium]|nr:N-acetylmuramoyl-L-alanine amidase [Planctomycetota bacterium]
MRRIACVGALVVVVAGCASPQRQSFGPLPEPILVTRKSPPPRRKVRPTPPPIVKPKPITKPAVRRSFADPAWYPAAGIKRRWQTIVVHHSASPRDTPQGMDNHHRNKRGWPNGLGYHFVIGNGVNYPDGKIYVGNRWKRQISGAHCANKSGTYFGTRRPAGFFNDYGIGVCLIGDFDRTRPTRKQTESLKRLVSFLAARTGIPSSRIYGHGHITKATACPGRNLTLSSLRRTLRNISATSH